MTLHSHVHLLGTDVRSTSIRGGDTPTAQTPHPVCNPGANFKSSSHRCYLRGVAFEWELTTETIYLPLGCLQGGTGAGPVCPTSAMPKLEGVRMPELSAVISWEADNCRYLLALITSDNPTLGTHTRKEERTGKSSWTLSVLSGGALYCRSLSLALYLSLSHTHTIARSLARSLARSANHRARNRRTPPPSEGWREERTGKLSQALSCSPGRRLLREEPRLPYLL